MTIRKDLLVAVAALAMLTAGCATQGATDMPQTTPQSMSGLATPEQIAFERQILRVLESPAMKAEIARVEQLYAADPPGTLRPWLRDEFLPFGVHDIWGHRDGKQHWEMQLMLAESEHDRWFARFDEGIGGPRNDLFTTYNGISCIRIEVQLLYKCRRPRPKDEADFAACLPLLSDNQCQWLATHIRHLFPDGHPWLDKLAR